MTANQIKFAEHKETARHNRVQEAHEHKQVGISAWQASSAAKQATVAAERAQEDARHNKAAEAINWWSTTNTIAETQRHNRETESQQTFANETARRNMELNHLIQTRQAAASEMQATAAHRQADVAQGRLALDREQLALNARDVFTREYNAETARQQVGLGYSQLAESIRHNTTTEAEQVRANTLVDRATHRQLDLREVNERTQRLLNARDVAVREKQLRLNSQIQSGQLRVAEGNLDVNRENAKSRRIEAITKGVDTGVRAASTLSGLAASIVGG